MDATGQPERINAVAYSHVGQIIAGGGDGGTVSIWQQRGNDWQRLPTPPIGEPESVSSLAFSPTEPLLAVGSRNTVTIWNHETSEVQPLPLADNAQTQSLAFNADGSLLGVGTDGPIVIFAQAEGHWTRRGSLTGHSDIVTGLAFSPTAPTVLASAGADGNVVVWDASPDPMLARYPPTNLARAKTIALNADGSLLGASGADGTIQIWAWQGESWDAATHTLPGHESAIRSLAFSPSERIVASGDDDGAVLFWSVDTGQQLLSSPGSTQRPVRTLVFSPDGGTLAAGDEDGAIVLWRNEDGQWRPGEPIGSHVEPITSLAFSPDGAILNSGDDGGVVLARHVMAPWKALEHRGLDPPRTVTAIAFRDNQTFFWGREDARVIESTIADGESKQNSDSLPVRVLSLALSPDDSLIAVGTKSQGVFLLDPANLQPIGLLDAGSKDRIVSIAFSADGTTLVAAAEDGTVTRWDVDLESWKTRACAIAGRPLSAGEVQTYLTPGESRSPCFVQAS